MLDRLDTGLHSSSSSFAFFVGVSSELVDVGRPAESNGTIPSGVSSFPSREASGNGKPSEPSNGCAAAGFENSADSALCRSMEGLERGQMLT